MKQQTKDTTDFNHSDYDAEDIFLDVCKVAIALILISTVLFVIV